MCTILYLVVGQTNSLRTCTPERLTITICPRFLSIDFSNLFPKSLRDKLGCDVLNGISVSKDPDILYVTGKKWDRMFKVRLLS